MSRDVKRLSKWNVTALGSIGLYPASVFGGRLIYPVAKPLPRRRDHQHEDNTITNQQIPLQLRSRGLKARHKSKRPDIEICPVFCALLLESAALFNSA